MRPATIPELLALRARETPDQPAFGVRDHAGAWQPVTWSAFEAGTARLALALARAGCARGTRVAILARTCLEWEQAQMAALRLGATVFGIDPNYPDDTLAQVLEAAAPQVLVVDEAAAMNRVPEPVRQRVRIAIAVRPEKGAAPNAVTALADFAARDAAEPGTLPDGPVPDDPAVVVFSSGTTGTPKPIRYTHRQVLLAVDAILGAFPDIGSGSRLACWLPLANLFQRIINFCAVARGAASYMVEDPREIVAHLPAVAPRVFIGVPRFFEKVHAGIDDRLAAAPAPARALARWAIASGRRLATGRAGVADRLLRPVADRLVLRRLRAVFGGDLRYLISGSAPMPPWLLEWFDAIGMPVFEAYGVSENIVPVAMNRPGARRLGTVGKPMSGNEIRLGPDGEVLVRGAGVFDGYLGNGSARPDGQGFWATGDFGEIDADGYLRLTGRKSDAFKTSGGRWVAPGSVEALLRQLSYVEHAVLLRSEDGAPVAILNVDLARFGKQPPARLGDDERARIARDAAGALDGVAGYARPIALLVVTTPFSIAGGELTTNLKLRRAVVADKFGAELGRLRRAPGRAAAAATPVLDVVVA